MPRALKITGLIARSIFIVALIGVAWRVSTPDNLTANALARFTLADSIRAAIGIATCIALVYVLFRLPRDEGGYRTWTFIGVGIALVWLVFAALRFALQVAT